MKETLARIIRAVFANLIKTILLLFAVSILTFALICVSPINPVGQYIMDMGSAVSQEQREEIEDYWGVNEPPVERYVGWLSHLVRGDLGESSLYRRSVADIIAERFLNSLALMLSAWVFSGITGFLLGCAMGMNQNRAPDKILKKICFVLSSLPAFWIGLVFLMVFSVWLGWFPIGFSAPVGTLASEITIWQRIYHLILPAFTLSITSLSNIALHTRQKLIDVLNSDYVLFARARGESDRQILVRHGLRNILFPAITLQFASFAEIFGGAVLVENVFSYPGLGSAAVSAGLNSDVPLLLGITLCSALFVCVGNAIADVLYKAADPKLREVRNDGM